MHTFTANPRVDYVRKGIRLRWRGSGWVHGMSVPSSFEMPEEPDIELFTAVFSIQV